MKKMAFALCLSAFTFSANSALIDRGGGFIYDDVLNITWTQDAKINGLGTWDTQMAWAAGLSLVDTRPGAGGVTYDDWRLPSMDVNGDDTIVDCSSVTELACRDNELGYLFHQYGISFASPGLFTNVPFDNSWSSTERAIIVPFAAAWDLRFLNGEQHTSAKFVGHFAWAVRDGDIAAVPVPAAVWLFGSALGLLVWIKRKEK